MRRSLTLIGLLPCLLLFACGSARNDRQSASIHPTQWQKDSLTADGNDADWTIPLPYTDSKEALAYSFSNDSENLYVRLITSNDATIQKILRGGFTLYINSHGAKEEAGAAGISFPTGNRVQKDGKLLNDRPELQQDKHIALNAVQDYTLFGFRGIKTPENFDYGKPNPLGIELAVGLNSSNSLVYEAKLPLQIFLNKAELINLNRADIAIGFVLENVPGQAGRNGGGGISIGGGLGLGSFGSGGGIGLSIGSGALANIGGRRQGKPVKIWNEVTLAKAP